MTLGKFDPLLVSYHNKKWILSDYDSNIIWKEAGQIEGVILDNNGIIGTWHYKLKNNCVLFNVKVLNNTKKINYKKIEKSLESIAKFLNKGDFLINYVGGIYNE